MPIYTMRCAACDHETDIFRKIAEMNRDLPEHCGTPMTRKVCAPMVQPDLAPYNAVAIDERSGARPVIQGRKEHREFLKRNGYVEVGNDIPTAPPPLKGDFNLRKELADATRQILSKH